MRSFAYVVATLLCICTLLPPHILGQSVNSPVGPMGLSEQTEEARLHKGEFKPPRNIDGKLKGWTVRMWHRKSGQTVPPWAATARQKGLNHVRRHAEKLRLTDADAELELNSEMEDDRSVTNVSMQLGIQRCPGLRRQLIDDA